MELLRWVCILKKLLLKEDEERQWQSMNTASVPKEGSNFCSASHLGQHHLCPTVSFIMFFQVGGLLFLLIAPVHSRPAEKAQALAFLCSLQAQSIRGFLSRFFAFLPVSSHPLTFVSMLATAGRGSNASVTKCQCHSTN